MKRISIGYELVTNPSLILLDEPTSGLDSVSALQVVKLLKRESARKVTLVATIHAPSSEVFLNFDRCILLADGHTIYNGSPQDIVSYFNSKGFVFKKFQNLADWLLKIAMDTQNLNPAQSITKLAHSCSQ